MYSVIETEEFTEWLAGLSRESLYKSLSGERAPSSDTLFKVMRALGLKLTVQPIRPA